MTDHLIFQLGAALGAMGGLAGHERRGSLTWPGRSAIIGLLGAALGIRRDGDFSALDALGMAVAVFDAGEVLRDYHTVETVPTAAARNPQSRPEAIRTARMQRKPNTTITLRDYRMGPLYGVALWNGDLPALCAALREPRFALYLGRRSCPLAAPLDPQIVPAGSPAAALAHLRPPPWRPNARASIMYRDAAEDDAHHETRHDIAIDRQAWHFAPRQVAAVPVDILPAGREAAP